MILWRTNCVKFACCETVFGFLRTVIMPLFIGTVLCFIFKNTAPSKDKKLTQMHASHKKMLTLYILIIWDNTEVNLIVVPLRQNAKHETIIEKIKLENVRLIFFCCFLLYFDFSFHWHFPPFSQDSRSALLAVLLSWCCYAQNLGQTRPPGFMPGTSPATPNLALDMCQRQTVPKVLNISRSGKHADHVYQWCTWVFFQIINFTFQ